MGSSIYHQAQGTVVRKRNIQPRKRRSRTKQPRSYTIKYFREPDPDGEMKVLLKLSYDPNDDLFPRQWVLSQGQLVLGVFRSEPKELWERLTCHLREAHQASFIPVPMDQQTMRQIIEKEEMNRIEFWARVWGTGRAKHSHPDLDIRGDKSFGRVEKGQLVLQVKP